MGGDIMPLGNWQFWIVTIVFCIALYVLIRPLMPFHKKRKSCCSSQSKKSKKTKLTIQGK